MEYREIVSVTGMGGLYQLVGSKKDGAIVRSLADNSTKFIPARLHNVTPLESIEIYTTGDNVRLHEVLQQMKDSSTARPDAKKASNDEIKAYFKEVYPDMDEDRVYASDMKKMLKWYELLQGADLLNFEALQQQTEEGQTEDAQATDVASSIEDIADKAVAGEVTTETPAPKKSRAKKSADEDAAAEGEEKPKKTARKKKTAEEGEGGEAAEKPAKKAVAKKKKEEGE